MLGPHRARWLTETVFSALLFLMSWRPARAAPAVNTSNLTQEQRDAFNKFFGNGTSPVVIASKDDGSVTVSTLVTVFIFILIVAAMIFLAYFLYCSKHDDEDSDEEREEAKGVREWIFEIPGGSVGPLTNADMKRMFQNQELNRETKVKVVWWEDDFVPLGDLFPAGKEFQVPVSAPAQNSAQRDEWHKYSIHHGKVDEKSRQVLGLLFWFYQAPDGQTYGPYENGKMRHWYVEGYFPLELMVKTNHGVASEDFFKLSDLFQDDLGAAFQVPPSYPKEKKAGLVLMGVPIGKTLSSFSQKKSQDSRSNRGDIESPNSPLKMSMTTSSVGEEPIRTATEKSARGQQQGSNGQPWMAAGGLLAAPVQDVDPDSHYIGSPPQSGDGARHSGGGATLVVPSADGEPNVGSKQDRSRRRSRKGKDAGPGASASAMAREAPSPNPFEENPFETEVAADRPPPKEEADGSSQPAADATAAPAEAASAPAAAAAGDGEPAASTEGSPAQEPSQLE
eukprot:TRINITY_DN12706_c0_g1_i1.p1 TRINITY_DN12706_c0_g1~~TRINITY_DN12706_c0_g1_i1.p1  ORF type:complete len:520 (-),score=98.02 TRINITY_DN12706_c0_g1_i1:37-1557(-)